QDRIQQLLAQVLLRKFRRRTRRLFRGCGRVVVLIVVAVGRLRESKRRKEHCKKQCEKEVYSAAHETVKCRYIWCPAQARKLHARAARSGSHEAWNRPPGRPEDRRRHGARAALAVVRPGIDL